MAVKLSDLTTESAPASTDIIGIADPTTGVMRKITVLALKEFMDGLGGSSDTTAPTVVSATATAGSTVVVVFSESVTVTTAGWSFKQNGSAWSASSVSGSGATWTFTMATSAISSDTLLYSYSAASGSTVDTASNELANITDASITNSISGTAPTVTSAGTANDTTVQIVFSQSMTAVTTAGWSFKKEGVSWTLSSVSGSGTTWNFEMGSAAVFGDVLQMSYNPTTGATIGTSLELGSFTDAAVTNNVPDVEAIVWANATANFTDDGLGGFTFSSVADTIGARASKKLTGSWSLYCKLEADDANSGLVYIYLSSVNNTDYNFNNAANTGIVGGFTTNATDIARMNGPTTETTNNQTIGTGIIGDAYWILMEKSGDDLLYYTSPDGVTYTLRSTDTGALTGVTDVFIKALNGSGATGRGLQEVKAAGLATI